MDFVEGACDELPSEYADQCKGNKYKSDKDNFLN